MRSNHKTAASPEHRAGLFLFVQTIGKKIGPDQPALRLTPDYPMH